MRRANRWTIERSRRDESRLRRQKVTFCFRLGGEGGDRWALLMRRSSKKLLFGGLPFFFVDLFMNEVCAEIDA
jgi:hypothetical protein